MSPDISWIERFSHAMIGWRKFIVAMSAIVASWHLCAIGQVESSGFVTAVLGVLALFGAANALAKYAPAVEEGVERS